MLITVIGAVFVLGCVVAFGILLFGDDEVWK